MDDRIGERFAHALSRKDREGLLDVLNEEIDFRGMTPSKFWEASSAKALVDEVIFGAWFEPQDKIDSLEGVQVGSVADRRKVAYRLRVRNPEGLFLVEQQVYFSLENGRINWLRVMCSGFRPMGGDYTES